MAPSIVDQFEERFGVYIHIAYCLTESNSPTHFMPLGNHTPVDGQSSALSIGKPVPNREVRLVKMEDPSEGVLVGESGELAASGPMIEGYWNKPRRPKWPFRMAISSLVTWRYGRRRLVLHRRPQEDMINVSGYKVWPCKVEDVL